MHVTCMTTSEKQADVETKYYFVYFDLKNIFQMNLFQRFLLVTPEGGRVPVWGIQWLLDKHWDFLFLLY